MAVFRRDNFTCQYCGDAAPDACLTVDHILAVANGGNNFLENLTTACSSCNSGKGAQFMVPARTHRAIEEAFEVAHGETFLFAEDPAFEYLTPIT